MLLLTLLACDSPTPVGPFALAFDGGEDCVEVDLGDRAPADTFTVEAWIRGEPEPAERPRPIVSWNGVFTLGEALGGDTTFAVADNPPATSAVTVMDGYLHHLAGVYDGEKASLYVDGVRQAFADATPPVAATATLRIGCDSEVNAYEGLLDEVRVSNGVRYADDFEVPTGNHPDDADTFALFHFDEGEGDQSFDDPRSLVANVYGADWIAFALPVSE